MIKKNLIRYFILLIYLYPMVNLFFTSAISLIFFSGALVALLLKALTTTKIKIARRHVLRVVAYFSVLISFAVIFFIVDQVKPGQNSTLVGLHAYLLSIVAFSGPFLVKDTSEIGDIVSTLAKCSFVASPILLIPALFGSSYLETYDLIKGAWLYCGLFFGIGFSASVCDTFLLRNSITRIRIARTFILFLTVIEANERGAILASILIITYGVYLKRKVFSSRQLFLFALLALGFLTLFFNYIFRKFLVYTTITSTDSPELERIRLFSNSVLSIGNNILTGIGPGRLENYSHNLLLQPLVDFGLLSIPLLILLVLPFFAKVFRKIPIETYPYANSIFLIYIFLFLEFSKGFIIYNGRFLFLILGLFLVTMLIEKEASKSKDFR